MQKTISFFILFLCSNFLQARTDSLDIKIGQMIMMGIQGTAVDDHDPILKEIHDGKLGGILYYERNLSAVNTARNLKTLSGKLQSASPIPLLISIDQEGGQVNRLKEKYGFNAMPSAKSIGDQHDYTNAFKVATTIGKSLASCNINLNYAPVLDIHNPICPVLGKRQRCYSSNPDSVSYYGGITIKAHHDQHILTVVKHFPGHGNSRTDSHLGMADVTNYWKKDELMPYKTLIEKDLVDAIMTGHIINRNLDSSGLPATLSKKIINGLLRQNMGYKGVIISDDMQMHAISSHYGFEESILKSINAGVDILMFSNNIKGATDYSIQNIHATIKRLVQTGKISAERINESYDRIMILKNKMKI